jgi:thioredoxin-related protein
VYGDRRVVDYVDAHFIPVRVHARHDPADYRTLSARFDVEGTPTALVIDARGRTLHKIEGFVPPDEFLSQLEASTGGSVGGAPAS